MSIESSASYINAATTVINTKGAWSELLASSALQSKAINVTIGFPSAALECLTDIGTGAGGAEVVVISDIPQAGGTDWGINCPNINIPLNIAASTRIACRTQVDIAGAQSVGVAILIISGSTTATTTTYGADTTNSDGSPIDCGAVVNTKGAYTEITASTSATHDMLSPVITGGQNTSPQYAIFFMDISTGAGGAETVVIPDIGFISNTASDVFNPVNWALPLDITSGTRIAARAKCGTTDATDRVFDLVIIASSNSQFVAGGTHSFVS